MWIIWINLELNFSALRTTDGIPLNSIFIGLEEEISECDISKHGHIESV